MDNRFLEGARHEIEQQEGFRRWMAERIATIHASVSASDVLSRNGVKLRYSGKRPEQIFCPFHGNTRTPAARYHPADARQADHVWCFVCNQRWDVIALFKKYAGYEGKFSGLLRMIERDYGITPPEAPTLVPGMDTTDSELDEVLALVEVCERRLRNTRKAFQMRSYLILGAVLDKVTYGINNGSVSMKNARETLQQVLDKIGEKERACPVE